MADAECGKVHDGLYDLLNEYQEFREFTTEPLSTSSRDRGDSETNFLAGFDSFISSTMSFVQTK